MKNQVNFSKNSPQDFNDMGGKHQAVFAGRCVVCNTRVYQERDYLADGTLSDAYNPDWRGVIGSHSCDSMIAEEYGETGADVLTCAECANDYNRYNRALEIAQKQWNNQVTTGCIYDHDHAASPQDCIFHN